MARGSAPNKALEQTFGIGFAHPFCPVRDASVPN